MKERNHLPSNRISPALPLPFFGFISFYGLGELCGKKILVFLFHFLLGHKEVLANRVLFHAGKKISDSPV